MVELKRFGDFLALLASFLRVKIDIRRANLGELWPIQESDGASIHPIQRRNMLALILFPSHFLGYILTYLERDVYGRFSPFQVRHTSK